MPLPTYSVPHSPGSSGPPSGRSTPIDIEPPPSGRLAGPDPFASLTAFDENDRPLGDYDSEPLAGHRRHSFGSLHKSLIRECAGAAPFALTDTAPAFAPSSPRSPPYSPRSPTDGRAVRRLSATLHQSSPLSPHYASSAMGPRPAGTPSPSARRLSLHHPEPLVGSYEESLLSGRMSTPSSRPLRFVARIGVLGKGAVPAKLRCPRHLTLDFEAVYYDLREHMSRGSPYIGLVDLDTHFAGRAAAGRPAKFPGYRVPPEGQIQIVISNPNRTAIKLFLVPFNLRDMPAGTKTFVRQKTYVRDDGTARGLMRQAAHLQFVCPEPGRYYLYTNVRVVFENRVLDGTTVRGVSPSSPSAAVSYMADAVRAETLMGDFAPWVDGRRKSSDALSPSTPDAMALVKDRARSMLFVDSAADRVLDTLATNTSRLSLKLDTPFPPATFEPVFLDTDGADEGSAADTDADYRRPRPDFVGGLGARTLR
ncbi:uncharacterized protein V1510DRAFT_416080 [Dipodascopsis tothii]|uniref:uncharacterized protein n=1 Tax=Dipodascopsis tothii TaxID=44089 RepID=UPI0034CF474C